MADDAKIAWLEAELQRRAAELRDARAENAALRADGEQRDRALSEALEQQTATAEVLGAIASSPTQPQTVLHTLVETAARLTRADIATLRQISDGSLLPVATYGRSPAQPDHSEMRAGPRRPLSRDTVSGRAFLERRTIHVPDMGALLDSDYPAARNSIGRLGNCAQVSTPLMREDGPIGILLVQRYDVRPFTEQEIKVLEIFADQAVIAIENARLFQELEQRNADLQESNGRSPRPWSSRSSPPTSCGSSPRHQPMPSPSLPRSFRQPFGWVTAAMSGCISWTVSDSASWPTPASFRIRDVLAIL